jgi:hypothetical protein
MSDTEQDSSDEESLTMVMSSFTEHMVSVDELTQALDSQVRNTLSRLKRETIDWLTEPLMPKPPVKEWLEKHGQSSPISMEQFLDTCYSAAKTMDLESRMLTFSIDDAAVLCNARRRISLFDLVANLPNLFD